MRVATLIGAAFLVGFAGGLSRGVSGAGQPPTVVDQLAPASRDTERLFSSDRGMILDFLQPGQGPAFERTMKRVAEALTTSPSNDRRRQAEGWRIYRAQAPLDGGVVLYISLLDPAIPGMDYWVPQILDEAFPTEVQELYDTYAEAYADGQMLQNLTLVYGE